MRAHRQTRLDSSPRSKRHEKDSGEGLERVKSRVKECKYVEDGTKHYELPLLLV